MSAFGASWLALREPYDHAARSAGLAGRLVAEIGAAPHLLDLGCGTGSNLRYLAPRITGPQHWRCIDHDPALLDAARLALHEWARGRGWASDRNGEQLVLARPAGAIAISFAVFDLARDGLPDPAGVAGLTGSALLDLTSAAWLDTIAARCRDKPLLMALSFDGRLLFEPTVPEDDEICRRFLDHQRTDKGFGPALGPDAAAYLAERLAACGCAVTLEAADWHLGPAEGPLLEAQLEGLIDAVREVAPDRCLQRWAAQRRKQLASGDLRLTVGHLDLLALPGCACQDGCLRHVVGASAPGERDMPKAIWNDHVIAETEQFEEVEGNIYFPPETLNRELIRPSERTTVCGWKGTASYFDLVDGDEVAPDAVWTYPDPKPAAANIKDYVAFYCPPVRIEG